MRALIVISVLALTLAGCGGGGGGGGGGKADLRWISGSGTGESTLYVGTEYDILAEVINDGDAQSKATKVLYETSNGDSLVLDIPALNPGQTYDPGATFQPEESDIGELTLTITVDPDDLVDESDESNNSEEDTVTVEAAPPT